MFQTGYIVMHVCSGFFPLVDFLCPTTSTMLGQEEQETNVYIAGLSKKVTEDQLRAHFESYGTILSCRVVHGRPGKSPKGVGFVQYTTPEMAMSAVIQTNNTYLGKSKITVRLAHRDKNKGVQNRPSTNIFVCNLPQWYRDGELYALFSPYGAIKSLVVLEDRKTGQSKGVGLIRFKILADSTAAVESLNGWMMEEYDRPLEVKFAEDTTAKEQRVENDKVVNGAAKNQPEGKPGRKSKGATDQSSAVPAAKGTPDVKAQPKYPWTVAETAESKTTVGSEPESRGTEYHVSDKVLQAWNQHLRAQKGSTNAAEVPKIDDNNALPAKEADAEVMGDTKPMPKSFDTTSDADAASEGDQHAISDESSTDDNKADNTSDASAPSVADTAGEEDHHTIICDTSTDGGSADAGSIQQEEQDTECDRRLEVTYAEDSTAKEQRLEKDKVEVVKKEKDAAKDHQDSTKHPRTATDSAESKTTVDSEFSGTGYYVSEQVLQAWNQHIGAQKRPTNDQVEDNAAVKEADGILDADVMGGTKPMRASVATSDADCAYEEDQHAISDEAPTDSNKEDSRSASPLSSEEDHHTITCDAAPDASGAEAGGTQQEEQETNVYIAGLSKKLTDDDLRAHFESYGTILSCRVVHGRPGKSPKGVGFVQYTTPEMAMSAVIQTNNTYLGKSKITVRLAHRDKNKGVQNRPSTNIFVCNLPQWYRDGELYALFSPYGAIKSLVVLEDRKTGQSKGVGLIRFKSLADSTAAVESLNGWMMEEYDRPLEVKFAEDTTAKEQRIEKDKVVNGAAKNQPEGKPGRKSKGATDQSAAVPAAKGTPDVKAQPKYPWTVAETAESKTTVGSEPESRGTEYHVSDKVLQAWNQHLRAQKGSTNAAEAPKIDDNNALPAKEVEADWVNAELMADINPVPTSPASPSLPLCNMFPIVQLCDDDTADVSVASGASTSPLVDPRGGAAAVDAWASPPTSPKSSAVCLNKTWESPTTSTTPSGVDALFAPFRASMRALLPF